MVDLFDLVMITLMVIIAICLICYFSPKKPKQLSGVKLKRKVLVAHGLQGFYWETKQVLHGDYFFIADKLCGDGWVYECEIYMGYEK